MAVILDGFVVYLDQTSFQFGCQQPMWSARYNFVTSPKMGNHTSKLAVHRGLLPTARFRRTAHDTPSFPAPASVCTTHPPTDPHHVIHPRTVCDSLSFSSPASRLPPPACPRPHLASRHCPLPRPSPPEAPAHAPVLCSVPCRTVCTVLCPCCALLYSAVLHCGFLCAVPGCPWLSLCCGCTVRPTRKEDGG